MRRGSAAAARRIWRTPVIPASLRSTFATWAARPIVRGPDAAPVNVRADQLEVSPDCSWLCFQPATGLPRRVPTAWLDEPDAAASLYDRP